MIYDLEERRPILVHLIEAKRPVANPWELTLRGAAGGKEACQQKGIPRGDCLGKGILVKKTKLQMNPKRFIFEKNCLA